MGHMGSEDQPSDSFNMFPRALDIRLHPPLSLLLFINPSGKPGPLLPAVTLPL